MRAGAVETTVRTVLQQVCAPPAPDCATVEQLQPISKAGAPVLAPRLGNGMPADAPDSQFGGYYRGGDKFNERYIPLCHVSRRMFL